MMPRLLPLLIALPLVMLIAGCANESTPYNEQTAQIDPAMNQPDRESDTESQTEAASTRPYDGLDTPADEKVVLTDEQWKAVLSEDEFLVLRRSGTERPGTGRYLDHGKEEKGAYHCAGCGNYLYDAKHKFHSGCGWPSFNQAVAPGAITTHEDYSYRGILRIEMRCARCGGHLGHIFDDAPGQPTGMRHCVNGTALIFVPEGEDPTEVIRKHREKYANR